MTEKENFIKLNNEIKSIVNYCYTNEPKSYHLFRKYTYLNCLFVWTEIDDLDYKIYNIQLELLLKEYKLIENKYKCKILL